MPSPDYLCGKCGHRFDPDEGFVGIHFSEGRTPVEQLQNGRVLHICAECAAGLRSWVGIRPVSDPLQTDA